MRRINQADFVGQEQQDGVNRNTSRIMIPQVVYARPGQLGELQDQIKKILCKLVTPELESSNEPVDENTLTLIQELVDTKEPAQFCDRLEEILNILPQSSITVYLKKNLPPLRESLMLKDMVFDMNQPTQH